MQIPTLSSLYGLAATPADPRSSPSTDNGSLPAGFASLLLQTNQALQAPLAAPSQAPQPASATPPPQPVAAAPMPKPTSAAPPAAPANGSNPASASSRADADQKADAATSSAADTAAAANASSSAAAADSSTTASNSAAAQARRGDATRTAQRAKLRAADGAAPGSDGDDAVAADGTGDTRVASRKDAAAAAAGSDGSVLTAALTNPAPAGAPLPPVTSAADTARSGAAATGTGRGQIDLSDPQNVRPGAGGVSGAVDLGTGQKHDVAGAAGQPVSGMDAAAAASGSADLAAALSPGVAFSTLLAEQQAGASGDNHPRVAAAIDAGTANASAFGATGPTNGSTATVATAIDLPTAVNAPDFAQQLGVQVSVLAKDGVQHAELHLNPADMGPVSVQITMEGTQARVDFGAEVAATRHAIEAGLPALASALADAGYTLAGGGVSQHAGNGGRGDGSSQGSSAQSGRQGSSGSASVDAAGAGTARTLRRTVSAGGVDLYA